jgi:alpha,alpha-trehalose phosphorylase
MSLVYGFAGMRDHGGVISFRPRLPTEWQCLRFALAIRGKRLRVETGHDVTTYTLNEGDELTIHHDGEAIALTAAAPEATRATPSPVPEPSPEFAPALLPQAV